MEELDTPPAPYAGTAETPTERSVRLARLCADVIRELTETAHDPGDPDSRADLLLEVEDLVRDATILLAVTRKIAWQD